MGRRKKEIEEITDENNNNAEVSKNLLGSLLNGYKEEHFAFVQGVAEPISSGSLLLDSLIKLRSGSVVRLVGKGAELGKTSQAFVLAGKFMNKMEKSKTIYIKSEGRLSPEMIKRSGHKFVFDADSWDYGTVFVLPCNIFETVAQMIETLVHKMHEQGEYLCVIIDSLDGLMLRHDYEKNVWGGKETPKVAGVPLLTKLLFKRLALPINHYDALLLVTGQYSANINLDPYSPNIPRQAESSGGNSIAHQSDYVFSYSPRFGGDYILENPKEKPDPVKNKIIGVYATIEIKKSGTDVSGTKIKIPIKKGKIGNQIWISKEVGDMVLQYELAKAAGAWISFDESIIENAKNDGIELQPKIQGINNFYDYLEQNENVCNWFYNKFQAILE